MIVILIAMANIARHVIANEYSEDVQDSTSNSDTGRTPSTVSEDARDDSPVSTTSSQDHIEPPMVMVGGREGEGEGGE